MSIITSERRSRLVVLLTNLAEGQREHEEITRLGEQIRTDYHGRFLIELIQNAIDPAQAAGIERCRLLIVRTGEHLAVLNQGAPFDETGLRALLSLGLSSKQPDEAIGNKGVGFKSVFEVAGVAEVFGVEHAAGCLADTAALRLAISRAPASQHPGLIEEALALASELGHSKAIEQRTGSATESVVREALEATAGWRFPAELSEEDWRERCVDLGLAEEDLLPFQTAVVLRLLPGRIDQVSRAMLDLTDRADEVHLFLPGLERVEVRDGDERFELVREELVAAGPGEVGVRGLITTQDGEVVSSSRYWVMSTVLEGPEVAAAAAQLPGPGWASVRRAEVTVALPVVDPGRAPAPDGRYFVGLPSKDRTGSPFRVDARFHATLSRTALDRVDNPYNRLLDEAAADLAAQLLRRLRDAGPDSDFLVDRGRALRSVVYGLSAEGHDAFGNGVRERLVGEPLVLSRSGARFLVPDDAQLVDQADEDLIELAVGHLGLEVLEARGLKLVDAELEREASQVLTALGCRQVEADQLLARDGDRSVIELLARELPRGQVADWTTLLEWAVENAAEALADQRFLPAVGGQLVSPEDAPFVPLSQDPARHELGEGDVPVALLMDLLFVDSTVLDPEEDLRRRLTEGQHPLCRTPSALDLLEHAVLPALGRLVGAGVETRAREILSLGLHLLPTVPGNEDVSAMAWKVPCGGGWLPADEAYLGDDWSDAAPEVDERPGIVEAVYGPVGRCVVAWWGPPGERAAQRAGLARVGVADAPRFLVLGRIERAIWGDYHQGTVQPHAEPDTAMACIWEAWLESVIRTPGVDWGPRTFWHLDGVRWIDGLERPEATGALAAWAVAQRHVPALLVPQQEPNSWGRRYRYKESVRVVQPWVFALRQLDRPFIPSKKTCVLAGALARPEELCALPSRSRVPSWVPQPGRTLNEETLKLAGVRPLSEMPTEWLVQQLDRFARSLPRGLDDGAVARGLWTLLGQQVRKGQSLVLSAALLPVWKDGRVVVVEADEVRRLVLVDDAYAAEILGPHLDGVCLLEQGDADWASLLSGLREALPEVEVEAVGEMGLPYEFDPSRPTDQLVGVLRTELGARVLAAIAAILHSSGVAQKEMLRCWAALQEARVQLGALPSEAPAAVWLGCDAVLLAQRLTAAELVSQLWPVIGPRWRNGLLAMGEALRRGSRGLADHLRHERLNDETIADAAAFFGLEDWDTDSAPSPMPPVETAQASGGAVPLSSGSDELEEKLDFDGAGRRQDASELATLVKAAPLPTTLPAPVRPSLGPAVGSPLPRAQTEAGEPGVRRTNANEEYAREIGHLGELYAFRVLSDQLPGFDAACWVSSSRALIGEPGGDDALGYDFIYVDQTGRLAGQPGAICHIEAKANARAMRQRFSMSRNEWEDAEACHDSPDLIYIVLRVCDLGSDRPAIGAVLVDPFGMEAEGHLVISPKDGWWVTLR